MSRSASAALADPADHRTVLSELIDKCPSSIAGQNRAGELPLHCAVLRGVADREAAAAMGAAVGQLLAADESALQHADKAGRLPLHAALWSKVPGAVARQVRTAEKRFVVFCCCATV